MSQGKFSHPFEEPTISGTYPDTGSLDNPLKESPEDKCKENENGQLVCKPAAGSIALLGDGRLLYFNALEGTENVEYSIFFEAGHAIINDQTRVLSLGKDKATWLEPSPVDGGANEDGYDSTTLLDGGLLDTTNDDDYSDGALFCADVVSLPNGEIMAVGGTDYYAEPGVTDPIPLGVSELEGLRNARIFNPDNNTWRKTDDMTYGRWYPTAISLAEGNVFVASGVTKLIKPLYPEDPESSGRNVTQTETYFTNCSNWAENGPSAERSLPLYPRLHLLPNGQVYYNGAGQAFNPFGQAYDQALWNIVAAYDPVTKSWSDLGYAGLPLRLNEVGMETLVSGLNPTNDEAAADLQAALEGALGTLIEDPASLVAPFLDTDPLNATSLVLGSGFRGSTFSLMMPLRPNANGQYNQASFLTAGGVLGAAVLTSPGGHVGTALARIDTVDISDDGSMRYSSKITGELSQGRWYGTGVLLPNGQAMVFSGADRDEVQFPGGATPILQTELYDPETGTWTTMATQNKPRTYHNTALLLPDGSVLVGGHAPINTAYAYSVTIPGFSPNDGRDPSFEIYYPPYMYLPRPVITNAPATAAHGENIKITVPSDAADIESIMLVRRTDLTHLVDADQRSVQLEMLSNSAGRITARIPANAAVVPPGDYMLFVNARGEQGLVPSESMPMRITGAHAACY
ncbi:galactose oxidase-like domain-containing protein [Litorivivens sp.]|uniref:galactose oxidase-like domain-containing protein n=1 Tax=Litorivivens sp. TaxID=2020868 RepID=UPI003561B051